MRRRRLLRRLASGALNNVRFRDLVDLAEGFGFRVVRIEESHHVFTQSGLDELISLQDHRGEAKPYQIRQLLRLVERYNLKLKDDA
ncbi:MAG: type II toxin-antitoxin system HicA family toxin [Chloroflexota bacterium]|nr:type II toxin-antitoxin system HicA family toxin [Chloroflexota bacterium]